MRETWMISLAALSVAFVLVAIFFATTGNSPTEVFYSLYRGAFGSAFFLAEHLGTRGAADAHGTVYCSPRARGSDRHWW